MRALVWRAPGCQQVVDVPDPVAGSNEVIVEVQRAGICGSDVAAHRGTMGTARPGSIRGHEFAGIVRSSSHPIWPLGARVAVNPVLTCGTCEACAKGRSSTCPSLEIIGVHRQGAFAELVAVPASQLQAIPDDMSWETAASVEPLAHARHDVQRAVEVAPLGQCLVVGTGSIGLGIVHALRIAAADAITVIDTDPRRHAPAHRAGASVTLESAELASASTFDTVFDVVGTERARAAAVSFTRPGGTLVAVGLGVNDTAIAWFDVIRREITVRGSNALTPDDFRTAMDWLAQGKVASAAGYRTVTLADAPRTFKELSDHGTAEKTFIDPCGTQR